MRTLPILFVLAVTATPSFAGDSSWLLCKGIAESGKPATKRHLVASALEHRGAKGDTRDLDVTILRGTHASRVVVKNIEENKPAPFTGKSIAGKVEIAGKLTLGAGMTALTIEGTLDKTPLTAKLACETLDDLAIAH